jgi:hypothetical protein
MAMNATNLKAKADAVANLGNAFLTLKANSASTRTAAVTAVQAIRIAVDELYAAQLEFEGQRSTEGISDIES